MTEPADPHRDLAGVLHDVSNALTVLLGWIGEARSPEATPEAVAYALTIIEQRARIARDLARHAIGSPRIDEQRELAEIVDEVAKALAVEAQRSAAQLIIPPGTSARVSGALDVAQVLTNLLLNAFAYAPRGSTVEVVVEAEEDECTIHVNDEGPGVPAHLREKIFNGTVPRDSLRPGGTGVGLRHSRALARVWGGDVALVAREAHEGRGASFRISWPRVDAVPRPPVSTSRVADLDGLCVLVVEDDLAVTQLLETVLEARGASVTVATTGEELLEAILGGPFDAALIDLSPIKDDALGAIAKLRERHPGATVILVTGNADALPVTLADDTVELVRKPFEMREVLAALARVPRRP